jgi:hypothetical protein
LPSILGLVNNLNFVVRLLAFTGRFPVIRLLLLKKWDLPFVIVRKVQVDLIAALNGVLDLKYDKFNDLIKRKYCI